MCGIGTPQVVYRGGNASVPIAISNAEMRLPAAVSYIITLLDGTLPPYIPVNLTEGYLQVSDMRQTGHFMVRVDFATVLNARLEDCSGTYAQYHDYNQYGSPVELLPYRWFCRYITTLCNEN